MDDGKMEPSTDKMNVWDVFIVNHKKYRNVSIKNLHAQLIQAKYGYESLVNTKDYRGMRLHGPPGVGKTHFIFAVIRDLIENHNMKPEYFEYISEEDLFSKIKSTFGYSDSNQILEKNMRRFREVPVLFYDDLGAATKTVGGEWGQQILMEIFNNRYKEEKTTFVTTNLSLENLTDLIGPRISDRLQDMHSIFIKGDSLRSEWKKQDQSLPKKPQ